MDCSKKRQKKLDWGVWGFQLVVFGRVWFFFFLLGGGWVWLLVKLEKKCFSLPSVRFKFFFFLFWIFLLYQHFVEGWASHKTNPRPVTLQFHQIGVHSVWLWSGFAPPCGNYNRVCHVAVWSTAGVARPRCSNDNRMITCDRSYRYGLQKQHKVFLAEGLAEELVFVSFLRFVCWCQHGVFNFEK